MNSFNLTCQKTHLLAWINGDDTLTIKLNGTKHLAALKIDKHGKKYWKVDSLIASLPAQNKEITKEENKFLSKNEVSAKQITKITSKPFHKHTQEDREKWAKWLAQENLRKSIQRQSQTTLQSLKEKLENKPTC